MASAQSKIDEQLQRELEKLFTKSIYAFFDWKELLSHVYDQVNAYTLDALLSITKEAELLVALIICRPLEDDLHQPKVKMRRNSGSKFLAIEYNKEHVKNAELEARRIAS
jgi:hypothetical protein